MFDEFSILESKSDDLACDRVGKGDIRTHVKARPHVGPLHGTRTPRINGKETRSVPDSFEEMMKENRMCLPGIRSPEKNYICLFNLLIGVCATASTKNRRQTGDARRVSSPVAAIDVVTAHHNARKLLSNEVHFVRCLGAAEQSKGLAGVLLDNRL
jgi:hypothetical protein